MENELCPYCHEDRDGYVQMLPREGNGNVFIDWGVFDGWILDFSGNIISRRKSRLTSARCVVAS